MMKCLTILICWHDSGWNGRICRNPLANKYCESFSHIRRGKYSRDRLRCGEFADKKPPLNWEACVWEIGLFSEFKGSSKFFGIKGLRKEETYQFLSRMGKGTYLFFYCRENPLSENRIIVGCAKASDIKLKEDKKGLLIDFEFKPEDIIFILPYQEMIEYFEEYGKDFPDDLVLDIRPEWKLYFSNMANFVVTEISCVILKEALKKLEKILQYDDGKLKAYIEDMDFRKDALRLEEFPARIQMALEELEGRKFIYPGLPAVMYVLKEGKEPFGEIYSQFITKWEEKGEEGEEEMRKELEKIIHKNDNFHKFLYDYAIYYEILPSQLVEIKKQIRKNFINIKNLVEKNNPYLLCEEMIYNPKEDIHPITFDEIDNWEQKYRKRFYSPYSKERIRALLIKILKEELKKGNTSITLNDLKEKGEKLSMDIDTFIEKITQYEDYIREKVEIERREEDIIFTLKDVKEDEKLIEEMIKELLKKGTIGYRYPEDDKFDLEQISAVREVLSSNVSILTGPAGSGKTHTIGAIVNTLQINGLAKVRIVAPTGKATVKINKEIGGEKATTIHRLIAQEMKEFFDFDYYVLKRRIPEDKKLSIHALIIDEASMVGTSLLADLFRIIKKHTLEHIIFVGDVNQLPPVEAGKPFHDIYNFFKNTGKGKIVELSKIYRANQKKITEFSKLFLESVPEREKIKVLREMMQSKERIKIGDEIKGEIYSLKNEEGKPVVTVKHIGKGDIKGEIEKAIEVIMEEYGEGDFFEFEVIKDALEILTPTRQKGRISSLLINHFIRSESKFIPDELKDEMYVNDFWCREKIKDKVIQNVNNYDKWVFNGMIGYVKDKEIYVKKRKIYFHCLNREVKYKRNEFSQLDYAYAITIHKSQGSDFDNVIVVIPKGLSKSFLTREMLYTAVTRARNRVYLITEEDISKLLEIHHSSIKERKTNLFGNLEKLCKKT